MAYIVKIDYLASHLQTLERTLFAHASPGFHTDFVFDAGLPPLRDRAWAYDTSSGPLGPGHRGGGYQ